MTNGEYYSGSFYVAFLAFNNWCENCIAKGEPWCRTENACEVCAFRWMSLPYDKGEGDAFMDYAKQNGMIPLPSNARAEREFLKACGVSSKENKATKKEALVKPRPLENGKSVNPKRPEPSPRKSCIGNCQVPGGSRSRPSHLAQP